MSDFILDYDILEAIAKNSNSLGKRSEEYAEQLESKIINAIGNVTGPSSGYLTSASDSVRDKINALKLKSEAFYHFAEQILNLLEVAEQIDQEVADAIAAGREYFLDHHESLRINDWKAKLLGLYVDLKNSIPLLGDIADILGGLDAIFESLKDSVKHWYECEGGKYVFEVIKSVVEVGVAIGFLALAVAALSLPGAAIFAVCGIIGAGIGLVNAVTNVATSFRAADAAMDGNPAWAMIYGKQDRLSDVLWQTNFGNGVFNDLSNLGAGAIDITETVCNIVGIAEAGVGASKLFKGDAFKLLKNKGALDLSGLKSGVKNGILDLKSSIKQGYKDLKGGINTIDKLKSLGNSFINPNKEEPLILSTRFLNRMDDLFVNAEKIKPIEGYTDIVTHGDKIGFIFKDANGIESNISIKEFAEIVKNCPEYNGGPIRLISCETGAKDAITAQYFANFMGVEVMAPTDIVYVYKDGEMIVGRRNTGTWKIFKPKE